MHTRPQVRPSLVPAVIVASFGAVWLGSALLGSAWLSSASLSSAWAQSNVGRVVTIVVPFAAGAPDSVARVMAKQLQMQLGQSIIVENRPAANGTIATEAVARAAPDGATLLITSASIAVNPSIYRKLPYDVLTDLAAVASICRTDGYVLAVNPSVPARTVQELVALARAPDNRLAYGSPGVGNTLHLAGELFKARTGIELTHVPYRGAGPAVTDLIGGQIQMMFVTPPLSLAHIQSGKLRPLAFTGATRWPVLPDVPTMAEAGRAVRAGEACRRRQRTAPPRGGGSVEHGGGAKESRGAGLERVRKLAVRVQDISRRAGSHLCRTRAHGED